MRYHNIEYVLNLPIDEFVELINKAVEKQAEEMLFQQWVVQLPYMGEKYISFNDYRDKLMERNIDKRSAEEILKDIESAFETQRKGGR